MEHWYQEQAKVFKASAIQSALRFWKQLRSGESVPVSCKEPLGLTQSWPFLPHENSL